MATSPTAGAAPQRLRTFSALRQREFGLLWYSGLGSSIGMGMQQIALGYFVFRETGSAFWVGAVAFMSFVPFFVLSPLAGVLGDRMDKRRLLFVAQAASGLSALGLALLITTGLAAMWQVLVLALVSAVGQTLMVPVTFAFVTELVAPRYLMNAVALNSLSRNGMRIVGPLLAGLLIAVIGAGGTMYINAAAFLLGLVPLAMLTSRTAPAPSGPSSVLRNIAEGLRFVAATPAVLFPILLSDCFALFGMPYISMLPVFAEEVLDRGATGLGLLSSATGVGSVAGAVLLAWLGDAPRKDRLFLGFYALFFIALILFCLSPTFYLALGLLFLVGAGSINYINVGGVLLQMATPRELQGRVMSLWTWGIGLSFLSALPIGALAEVYGAPAVMAGSAVIGLLVGGLLMLRYAPGIRPRAGA